MSNLTGAIAAALEGKSYEFQLPDNTLSQSKGAAWLVERPSSGIECLLSIPGRAHLLKPVLLISNHSR
jgi:hypothetical protein